MGDGSPIRGGFALAVILGCGRHPNVNATVTGAMEAQGGAQLTRDEKVAVVEGYLKGLVSKDISSVPFADDVTFEGPRVPPLAGREVVVGFLKMILPAIKDIQIKQHIVEGDYVATVFDMETADGIDRVFDRIRLLDGEVKEIHSFYYPRPLEP